MNRNVVLTFAFRLCDGLSQGIWNLAVLSNYIDLLGEGTHHASEMVGFAQALQGTCEAAVALPAGWLAGRMRRDIMLRCAGVVNFLAIAVLTASTFMPLHYKFLLLCVAMCLWGAQEATRPVLDSLFADSISTGQRTALYSALFATSITAVAVGPFIAALMMWLSGNQWSIVTLERVIQVGMVIALTPAAILFLFDDKRTLGVESEGVIAWVQQSSEPEPEREPLLSESTEEASGQSPSNDAAAGERPAGAPSNAEDVESGALQAEGNLADAGQEQKRDAEGVARAVAPAAGPVDPSVMQRRACGCLGVTAVPACITLSNCIFGLASGMTVKFFPVFFKDEVSLSPVTLNILFGFVPLLMSPMALISQKLAQSGLGRIQTILLCKTVGIGLLFYIAFHKSMWTQTNVIVPLFVLRTILMNSVTPLYKSVLMDYAPKGQRGIWSSIGSIASFGWSGSAAFGGWMIQHYQFGATFGITACMQVLALLMVVPLVQLVPRHENALAAAVAKSSGAPVQNQDTSQYRPPVAPVAAGTVGGAAESQQANGQ